MTPPATAAAPRSSARGRADARRGATARHPRRVSGPAGAGAAAAVAIPAPGILRPRRRPASKPRRQVPQTRGVALRAIDAFEGVSAGVLLDRLIRGRAWIALLAFALIGIVTMQMLVLELNTRVGHTLARAATLQRENAQLGIEDSAYSAESRVAPLAAAGGMTLAPAGSVHFVAANPADVARAAAALSTPIQTPETVGSSESLASATGSGG